MLGIGNSASRGSLAGSDVTQVQKIVIYESDFSSDADGFIVPVDGSIEGNASVGGQDDALKMTLGAEAAAFGYPSGWNNSVYGGSVPNDQVVQVKFLYYFPSTNAGVDSMSFTFDTQEGDTILDKTQDVWTTYESSIATSGTVINSARFWLSGGLEGTDAAEGDILYVKNIEIYYYG